MSSETEKIKMFNNYTKQSNEIRFKSFKTKILKADVQIQRLLNEKFYNPYDVLQLDSTANEEQIKKQYKNFSLILHPDKCKDPHAKDAWQIVQQAHKTLIEPEKRNVYLRIMREAKQRTQFQRKKQNKKRQKNGQQPFPDSTFQEHYQQICLDIFKDLEQKKQHIIKLQQSTFSRRKEEVETKKIIQQFKILTEEEWERSRQKRVANWRDFSKKKFVIGSKKSDKAIRPQPIKPETRPHYTAIQQKQKNI